MEKNRLHPDIDMEETGKRLKRYVLDSGYSVKEIQDLLSLSCPQPVYRWFKGQILPSVDHLFALSRLLQVPMEQLLAARGESNPEENARISA